MPLPPEIDAKIRQRFEDILNQTKGMSSNASLYMEIKTQLFSLMNFISPHSAHLHKLREEINGWNSNAAGYLTGYVRALKTDYEAGMFESLSDMIEANVVADYMGQAERLLSEGVSGRYDYVLAAILAGAVLEDALRRLCQRQNPPISITKPNGVSKSLGTYIDDLKTSGLYNELKAKQLRAWADIRNAAAHWELTEFERQDVETMLQGIQNFLADYL